MIILIFGKRAVAEADQAPATLGELLLTIYRPVRSWILNMLAVLIGRRKKFNRAPVGGKFSIFHRIKKFPGVFGGTKMDMTICAFGILENMGETDARNPVHPPLQIETRYGV